MRYMGDVEVEDTLRDSVKFADQQAQRIQELENQLAEMEYTSGVKEAMIEAAAAR